MAEFQTLAEAVRAFGPSQNKIVRWVEAAQDGGTAETEALAEVLTSGLFDPESELHRSLHELGRLAITKLHDADKAARGDVMIAAHTTLALLAFFDELTDPRWAGKSGVRNHWHLGKGSSESERDATASLLLVTQIPVPQPTEQWEELRWRLLTEYRNAEVRVHNCIGLKAGADAPGLAGGAYYRYVEKLLSVADSTPEFAIWALLRDGSAAIPHSRQMFAGTPIASIRGRLRKKHAGLAGLSEIAELTTTSNALPDAWTELAKVYAAEIAKEIGDSGHGLPSLPTLRDSYINPAYRITSYDEHKVLPHEDRWWRNLGIHEEIQGFLIRYLTTPSATALPLLILGHPGTGKSALTRVLAARLGEMNRPVVRVDLRAVAADAPIYKQLSSAIETALTRRVEWSDLARVARPEAPVVILDGLDELIQSSAVSRADYLELVREFQRGEAIQDRPVIVVVTSRTIVAQRVRIPQGTLIMRIEPFDDKRVAWWLDRWNRHQSGHFRSSGKRPLTRSAALVHRDLAAQPLLLFMLALYDAHENALQREGRKLADADLYERLLQSFAERETRKMHPNVEDDELARQVERELETLAVAAFAMFNRGSQAVLEDELAADLEAFTPPAKRKSMHPDKARKLVSRFFFVHVSQATAVDGAEERTKSAYEFLHATFGEYLVARLTHRVIMQVYEDSRRGERTLSMTGNEPDFSILGALLSFELLCSRNTITSFLRHLTKDTSQATLRALTALLARALRETLLVDDWGDVDGYRPRTTTIPTRLGLRTANLLVLVLIFGGGTTPAALFPKSSNPREEWARLAALWQATLPAKSWQLLTDTVEATTEDDEPLLIHLNKHTIPTFLFSLHSSLNSLFRLSQLMGDREIEWAFAALSPLMVVSAPPGVFDTDTRPFGAETLMQLAFPGDFLYSDKNTLITEAIAHAEASLSKHYRAGFLEQLVRLTRVTPRPLPTSFLAAISNAARLDDNDMTMVLAELLYEALRPDQPLPADLDEFREVVRDIAARLGTRDFGPTQVAVTIGLARLGIPDRDLPTRLCLLSMLHNPEALWELMGEDQHIAAQLLQVIRTTSRRRAAARAVRLLWLIPDPDPLVLNDVDVQYAIAQARRESPQLAWEVERRWHAALRRQENKRVLGVLQQRLHRGVLLTQVASLLRAEAGTRPRS